MTESPLIVDERSEANLDTLLERNKAALSDSMLKNSEPLLSFVRAVMKSLNMNCQSILMTCHGPFRNTAIENIQWRSELIVPIKQLQLK